MRVWLLGILLLGGSALARTPADYAREVDEQIQTMEASPENGSYGPYWCTRLTVNEKDHPWPAVGIYRLDYLFYFDRDEGDANHDPHPYPDRLVKVIGQRKASARWERREVWFQQGKPVFFVRSTPEGETRLDLTAPTDRRLQEAQREAGDMMRIFRTLDQLP